MAGGESGECGELRGACGWEWYESRSLCDLKPQNMVRILALLIGLLLTGCSGLPITAQSIQGSYRLHGARDGRWYAGESIELLKESFVYSIFTDVVNDPRIDRFPVRGRYSINGSLITLHHPAVPSPQRIITRQFGRFVLWKPEQHEAYLSSRRKPGDLLYQER